MKTSNFIVELGTEELPPQSLEALSKSFHDQLISLVKDSGLTFSDSNTYATPRRLAITISNLVESQEDKVIEKQGPAVTAAYDQKGTPTPAALGFARSCGVDVSALSTTETKKGERLCYLVNEKGLATSIIMPKLVQQALSNLPIPKVMRWGDSTVSFIRPVKWLLMMQDSKIVPCALLNCKASNVTYGHRFLSQGALTLKTATDYIDLLRKHFVIADNAQRKQQIKDQVLLIAKDLNATAVIEEKLLSEVTALVEWPVALVGNFDPSFLSVPSEALISTMSTNQKYFHLIDSKQNLIAKFITISNINSSNPETVIKGNERVIRPRLADAKFFYEQDCKHSLSSRSSELKKIVFQNKLGSVYDKTQRISILGSQIATLLSIDSVDIKTAAVICKSDLVSDMVVEFPSLQGIMGRYYAVNDGENNEVAAAMEEIYQPRFSGDLLPSTQTGTILALSDRLDTLAGIFSIGMIPSGNKDPFALRRAAVGILRIIIDKNLNLNLKEISNLALTSLYNSVDLEQDQSSTLSQLLDFYSARTRAMYLDLGFSAAQINSVAALNITRPLEFKARLEAIKIFSKMEQAASLAESNKRVANILAKNANELNDQAVDPAVFTEAAEQTLHQKILSVSPIVNNAINDLDYEKALKELSSVKTEIDLFFDTVMVMDDDKAIRTNRLALLKQLRTLFLCVADIALLQQ